MSKSRPAPVRRKSSTLTMVRRLADHGIRLVEAKALLADEAPSPFASPLVTHSVQRALDFQARRQTTRKQAPKSAVDAPRRMRR